MVSVNMLRQTGSSSDIPIRECGSIRDIEVTLMGASILTEWFNNKLGGKMKCIFAPEMECTVYDVMKELEADLTPTYILEKACPLCPKRPMPERPDRLKR
ncbi:MAG: hypothetical protein NWE77_03670 [Candidatus Bathyarchaeota archaeon]|nr:hypothetical protein [Candidatus Bathyarchaeota archaeon]